ncbi:hypothetical protein [Lysobacter capsici]|uniref:hypothetical protein n=1 Tax=Lysobacter capsici TaxID=435897 RepID=UPI001C0088EC|nr:hypothetical protein [Lysobacter capsici]QWF16693.1 hypothetical protein KME82_23595 [Lysobacter capsici]
MREIANYLDDGQARIGGKASEPRMTVAHLDEELRCTLGSANSRTCDRVERFNQCDHKQHRSIDEIAGRKWPL